jgi:hypothetical protein
MNVAFLKNNVVVCVAPTLNDKPADLVFDTSRDAIGANIGDTWNSSSFVQPALPPDAANERTLRQQGEQAIVDNKTFVAITNPTNAQVVAQVKALTRQMNGVMRLALGKFDGTD